MTSDNKIPRLPITAEQIIKNQYASDKAEKQGESQGATIPSETPFNKRGQKVEQTETLSGEAREEAITKLEAAIKNLESLPATNNPIGFHSSGDISTKRQECTKQIETLYKQLFGEKAGRLPDIKDKLFEEQSKNNFKKPYWHMATLDPRP